MIVATAIEHSATLVTADQKILDWGNLHQKIDASL
jgi:PIN domain nuclease of toxin-antitoxin system